MKETKELTQDEWTNLVITGISLIIDRLEKYVQDIKIEDVGFMLDIMLNATGNMVLKYSNDDPKILILNAHDFMQKQSAFFEKTIPLLIERNRKCQMN